MNKQEQIGIIKKEIDTITQALNLVSISLGNIANKVISLEYQLKREQRILETNG